MPTMIRVSDEAACIVTRAVLLVALLALSGCVTCSTCPPHTDPAHAELAR